MTRTEFGIARSSCECAQCVAPCRVMPGFLIPADLARLAPGLNTQFLLDHFEASEGTKVFSRARGVFTVRTIVPAQNGGGCVFLKARDCTVWENAPFGCAFFRVCTREPRDDAMVNAALRAILVDEEQNGPYKQARDVLHKNGKIALPLSIRKKRLNRILGSY